MQNDEPKSKGDFRGRAYRFALEIIAFVDILPKGQTSSVLTEQLLHSATSIGANLVEAQGAGSRKDHAHFFSYALKSANETKFWLGLLRDSGKAEEEAADKLLREVTELSKIIASSILTLKGKR
jgi:four helix bundle protein